MKSRSFRNNTISRVKNQLKTMESRARKIQIARVAIVYLGINEQGSYSLSSSRADGSDLTKVTIREEAIYRDTRRR